MKSIKKIVLAYSGGLDTSVAIRWLKDKYHASVIAYAAEVGQGLKADKLKKRAVAAGADRLIIDDLREEFLCNYAMRAAQAGAVYQGGYYLSAALTRPLIASHMVYAARKVHADALAHGCTGKGNDQVRFELTFQALAPEMKIIAPVREWDMKSRSEEIDYAKEHKIPVDVTRRSPYSIDQNLWGVCIECGVLEDPWVAPPESAFRLTVPLDRTPARPTDVVISFERGVPVRLNGKRTGIVKLVEKLNKLAGKNGIGRTDLVEDRLVGIKSREVYEAPAATVLYRALREIEALVLDRWTRQWKEKTSMEYAQLIYDGLWDSPLREHLAEVTQSISELVTGDVRLRLWHGNVLVLGRRSPNSLYDYGLATYERADMFDHRSAGDFIKIYGLPLKVIGRRRARRVK
jgi:argininosuccinate synthase